nr:transcription initiation factor TFIID subunit 9 [Cryptomonas sp.]
MTSSPKLCTKNLIPVLRLLREEGAVHFEKNVPWYILEIVYIFLWEILYKAKILSRHAGKRGIDPMDIKIALTVKSREDYEINKSCRDPNHIIEMINSEPIPRELASLAVTYSKSNSFPQSDQCKVLANDYKVFD